MMNRIVHYGRKAIVSTCISAAILALANIETLWQEYEHNGGGERLAEIHSIEDFTNESRPVRDLMPSPRRVHGPDKSELRVKLDQDEISESNPFQKLENQVALNAIINHGVVKFRREAYRSPLYQDENGYDLLSYEIDNKDGTHSSILAYREGEKGNARATFVVLLEPGPRGMSTFYFRDGKLLDQSSLSANEARTLIARHLSGGVPFLSVAR